MSLLIAHHEGRKEGSYYCLRGRENQLTYGELKEGRGVFPNAALSISTPQKLRSVVRVLLA